jgi:tetratricopeptide (TPR) repeat protein
MKNAILSLGLVLFSLASLGQTAQQYYDNGASKYAAGNFSGAMRDLNQAVKMKRDFAEAYHLRGNTRMRSFNQNEKAALSDYTKAIELDPRNPKSSNNRGLVKVSLGDYVGAIEDYNKALEVDPKAAYAYKSRGDAKKIVGDFTGALADYDKASEIELVKDSVAEAEEKKESEKEKIDKSNDANKSDGAASADSNGDIEQKAVITKGITVDLSALIPAEKEIIEAGVKLQQARRTFGAGLFLNLIGGGLIAGSGFTSNPKA